MVAEFIVLAVAGLRRTPAYRSVSLSRLAQEMRDEKAQPLVATFAAGSELLPVTALARRGRDALAYRLLAGYLVGRERATDLPAAGKLCRRWLAEQALDLGGLRLRIEHDRQGLPLQLALEPPEVGRIPDEWLVDSLLNWDTLLWKRWQRPDGPAARMAENATRLAERAGAWLDEELDELLQREPGGIRLAGLFVDEAAKALEDEQARTEDDGTVAGGWLKQLLASLQRPPRDPTLVPDLEASRQSLERALARRVNRRAVWTRAVFFSATLLAFLWTAYLAAGQELGLSGVVARLLESERHWRGMWRKWRIWVR